MSALDQSQGRHSGAERIGTYTVSDHSGRLSVADAAGLCVWLGLREPRVTLEIHGPSEVGDVVVERRGRRAVDIKRPERARPWELEARARDGKKIGRRLRFRRESDARAMAARIQAFAASA